MDAQNDCGITDDEHDAVGDHLHTAGGADIKKSAHMSRQARALRKLTNLILDGKEGFVKR